MPFLRCNLQRHSVVLTSSRQLNDITPSTASDAASKHSVEVKYVRGSGGRQPSEIPVVSKLRFKGATAIDYAKQSGDDALLNALTAKDRTL
jgi:hypothetical protein